MIFVDTVAWLYLFDDRQGGHPQQMAKAFIQESKTPLCTSDLVIAECHKWLVHHGRPSSLALTILKTLIHQEVAQILELLEVDRQDAVTLVSKYADQKLSYTDACTVSLMMRTKIKQLFTFDSDFRLFPKIEIVPDLLS